MKWTRLLKAENNSVKNSFNAYEQAKDLGFKNVPEIINKSVSNYKGFYNK